MLHLNKVHHIAVICSDYQRSLDFYTQVLGFRILADGERFAGGSEFWIKIGAVEDFTAATEPELRLYQPSITDFMLVVRRDQVGEELPFNAVLVSEWTEQLNSCAYMMVEDDGGLTALIYPDWHQGELDGYTRSDFKKRITGLLPAINDVLPKYAQIKKIELMPEDFERTPKKSIKRYLYQRN